MDKSSALQVCTALGQSTRMDVVQALVRAGHEGLPAGDLSSRLDISHNLMSSHLKRLTEAGLVSSDRQGRNIIYRVRFDTLRGLLQFLMKDCCQGHPDIVGTLNLNPQTQECAS
ncbi:MAG: metalloregulator ArsR/SmtB family transcription factor [Pseudomonadota bacterium]